MQQRRLSKLVLERQVSRTRISSSGSVLAYFTCTLACFLTAQAKNLNERLERATAEARKRASTGASYSTSKARRQRAEKVSQKEAKREKTRAARNKAKDRQEL